MKAEELRIGNILKISLASGSGRAQYLPIGCQDLVRIYGGVGSFNYESIQLTEEWLVKFGFNKLSICEFELITKSESFNDGFEYYEKEETSIYINLEDEMTVSIDIVGIKASNHDLEVMSTKLKHVKHVHQLQNLYFTLTNEELTIK